MVYILATQSEVHRPGPSLASFGSLLEMQDLRCHPRPTIMESPGDLCAQYSLRSAGLYLLHSVQRLMGTHCVPGIVLSITDIKMTNAWSFLKDCSQLIYFLILSLVSLQLSAFWLLPYLFTEMLPLKTTNDLLVVKFNFLFSVAFNASDQHLPLKCCPLLVLLTLCHL